MAADLFDAYPAARALIEKANEVLGFDLSSIMFGPDDPSDSGAMAAAEEKLRRTDLTQPALYVHSLAADAVLREMGIRPDCAAGHSLGEYSALASAGALTFEDGLRIVRRRGELMAAAHEQQPGTMAAIIGLDDDVVVRVCQEIEDGGEGRVVRPANFNSPGQIVISGDENSVRLASAGAEQAGAKKVMPLSVGGAFHSPLMAFSQEGLADALGQVELRTPQCPVYLNVTASPTTDPAEIRRRLEEQLQAPVRWADTLRQMNEDGLERFIEVGAGKVLSGLVKRTIDRRTPAFQAGTAADLTDLPTALDA